MTLTKDWAKEWADNAPRQGGRFKTRGDEPMGPAKGLRFPMSVYNWIQEESSRRGIKFADMVRLCVEEKMKRMSKA